MWWLWKWRNGRIFKGEADDHKARIQWLKRHKEEVNAAFAKVELPGKERREGRTMVIIWDKPDNDTYALNVDGSVDQSNNKAGCAGVLRDTGERWKGGYVCKLQSPNTITESWDVLKRLEWAWNKDYIKVGIQSNSQDIINLLQASQ